MGINIGKNHMVKVNHNAVTKFHQFMQIKIISKILKQKALKRKLKFKVKKKKINNNNKTWFMIKKI